MELGEKLLRARQEAGLSQRQLCGEEITRNMLSQIEHGTAKPSMKTLRYLASRLGKPVSYFLEEEQLPNRELLEGISLLIAAEEAIIQKKYPYARQLLERAGNALQEAPVDLERRRLLLLGRLPGEDLPRLCGSLPGLDEELLLRAEAALVQKNTDRAESLLAAAEDREVPRWNLLKGKALLLQKNYAPAVECLCKAEAEYPQICWPLLEEAFREMGDFRRAYLYACKQK